MAPKHTLQYIKQYIADRSYTLVSDTYSNSKQKLHMICPVGHDFEMSWNAFSSKGYRCSYCSGIKRHRHADIQQWVGDEGYSLKSTYVNSKTPLDMECPRGHDIKLNWTSFQQGVRCAHCAGVARLTIDYVRRCIQDIGYELISTVYVNGKSNLHMRCDKGHDFHMRWNAFSSGRQRCPLCVDVHAREEQCRTTIERITGHKFVRNRSLSWLKNPRTNRCLELDGYCPQLSMAFEYQGIQHYSRTGYSADLDELQWRDQHKLRVCTERGVFLIVIPYTMSDDAIERFIYDQTYRWVKSKRERNGFVQPV